MRLVQAYDGRGGVTLVHVPVPAPGPGQVLVRMAASPVNPSDLSLIYNVSGKKREYPLPAGREGSGLVVAAGRGLIARRLVGKRVAFAGTGGAWADFACIKALNCVQLPEAISYEQGATLMVNPLTAVCLFDIARRGGHQAMVSTAAAGQLGQMILRLGLERRVPIIHVVHRREQVELLTGLGADHVLYSSSPGFEEELRERAARLHATLFLDTISGSMTGQLLAAAPAGSTILMYGNLSRQPLCLEPSRLGNDRIKIEGFFLGTWLTEQSLSKKLALRNEALRLVGTSLRTAIGRKFLLAEIDAALAFAQRHAAAGKALLVIDPELVDLR